MFQIALLSDNMFQIVLPSDGCLTSLLIGAAFRIASRAMEGIPVLAGVLDFRSGPDTYATKCSVSGRSDVRIFLKRSDLSAVDSSEEKKGEH